LIFLITAQNSAATKLAAALISRSDGEPNDADNVIAGEVANERVGGEMVEEPTMFPLNGKDKQH
jgi:hypothetical protein